MYAIIKEAFLKLFPGLSDSAQEETSLYFTRGAIPVSITVSDAERRSVLHAQRALRGEDLASEEDFK
jgi:hypothetical protein